jgi:hypothetical protein
MRYRTDRELAAEIRSRLNDQTSQRELAQEFKISPAYLCDFLKGKRGAGPAILAALGYETTPFYRKAERV